MNKILFCLALLSLFSCRNRNPSLSDKQLLAMMNDTTQRVVETPVPIALDADYTPPAGVKFTEIRSVDPANPPIVIDVANRNLNIKKFNLSDYYAKVRYVKLQHPKSASEENFFFDNVGGYASFDEKMRWLVINARSLFKFTNDYIIAGNDLFGLHCHDKEGNFLYTIESNDYLKVYDASRNYISMQTSDFRYFGNVTTIENTCLFRVVEEKQSMLCLYDLPQQKRVMTRPFEGSALFLDNTSVARYVYQPVRSPENFLFTFDLKGDTLCRFPNYQPEPEIRGGSYPSPPSPVIYYHGNRLTIRQSLNDTVYRVVSPNRLLPAYVLNFGAYQADLPTFFRGDLSEKLLPSSWKESDRYILFVYTQNRDTPNNRRDGSVQFFYSYYDKNSGQVHHFSEGAAMPDNEFFIENPIPDAVPFILSHADIEDKQLRVCYSKKRLEDLVNHKEFASLPPEQQNKLKTMQNELDDNEIFIMILE